MKGSLGRRAVLAAMVFVGVVAGSVVCAAQVSVTTWHNDNWRTGQNTSETVLTYANVKPNTFGLICSVPVNGEIFGQPLVVANQNGGMMVYVATTEDYVYAFNVPANLTSATCPTPTVVNLLQSFPGEYPADCCYFGPGGGKVGGCSNEIKPVVGVLGTPVIDPVTQTLYLVAESQVGPSSGYNPGVCGNDQPPSAWVHRLHALDLKSNDFLKEKFNGPVQIPAATIGVQQFNSQKMIQRPGLLWLQNQTTPHVYVAFSMMDGVNPHPSGWIFGYAATSLTAKGYPFTYATTPGVVGGGGGIWQSGAGPAAGVDSSGNSFLFFNTADGVFDLNTGGQDAANSFIKLTPNLQNVAGYFTPSDELYRWCNQDDLDFGSGGVTLVPDQTVSGFPYLAVSAEKENYLWVMDRTNPGGFNAGGCSAYCSACNASCSACPASAWANQNVEAFQYDTSTNYQTRSSPAYWNGQIFQAEPYGVLNKYQLTCSDPGPVCTTSLVGNVGMAYGTTPSISSNSTANGIVWTLRFNGPGESNPLTALRADTMARIYGSSQCPNRDAIGELAHFAVPTVANGYVFVGTQTDFDIFGLTTATCQ